MGQIKISPEQVRMVSSQFKQAGDQSQDMITKLNSAVHGMEPEWAGVTKTQFFQEFTQWESTMRDYVQLLAGISKQLDDIANRFEQADQSGVGTAAAAAVGRRSPQSV
jgi:WXG100 family type VII secretion target